jgi:hypothetical protein
LTNCVSTCAIDNMAKSGARQPIPKHIQVQVFETDRWLCVRPRRTPSLSRGSDEASDVRIRLI